MRCSRQVPAIERFAVGDCRQPTLCYAYLQGSEFTWAVAFIIPYAAVFLAFAVYPIAYGFWMGSKPSLYADLLSDPRFTRTAVNTMLFVGLGVNVMLFLALLLSAFFMRRRWWIKA